MSTIPTKEVVYLEDIPVSNKKEKPAPNSSPDTTNAHGKRQRTLLDMCFTPSADAKRQKLQHSTPAARFRATKDGNSYQKRRVLGSQTLNSIPFSLSSFVEGLSDEQRALIALECDVIGKSWLKVLTDELVQPYFLNLKKFLYTEGVRGMMDPAPSKIYPAPKNIYAWSDVPLGRVKVVILGQDPYPGAGQAHGLSFSVPPGISVPASLRNIYTELRNEYPDFAVPNHGHLASWASQGVLLLNSVLTVRAGEPNSHAERGWEQFTERVMQIVDAYGGANLPNADGTKPGTGRGVVVLAWGSHAAKRVAKLDSSKHLILKSAHPSPRSADRGFFGNGHFKKANEWLEQRYGSSAGIDWCKL
ncbi:unnamed protein product [Mycena citricolor]|uniref:Uracil-DNA glycosylase n=1 Tax=Mycena citricolor TaxID=2018698 RepID=A0AAD2H3C0_9AGAR|nr:unnamed protein product [Mycena citricolor]